jgi:hypothetical protein
MKGGSKIFMPKCPQMRLLYEEEQGNSGGGII